MEKLSIFRKELDELDAQLMEILARRFEVCRRVALYKAEMNIPMMQPERVAQVKQRAGDRAVAAGLDEQFGIALYSLIIDQACKLEDQIIEQCTPAEAAD
jgi:4-amino-4-deoxychorismate mutase